MKRFQTAVLGRAPRSAQAGKGGTRLVRWEGTHNWGVPRHWGMSAGQRTQRAVSRFGMSSNPSQKIIFVLRQRESSLNLPLIMLGCAVPISINRYGWNPMSSGIDCFHLYSYFRWNASCLDFCHTRLFFLCKFRHSLLLSSADPCLPFWKNSLRT